MNLNFFLRKRSFSFKSLSLFILSSLQSSIQRELDRFFKSYNSTDIAERFVTQSAFTQARKKIQPDAFKDLNRECIDHFYSNYKIKTWNDFRLVAIDGSQIQLPKNQETIAEFGEYTTNLMDDTTVLARISKSYDVLNNISIDAKIVNRKIGEHPLAKSHLDYIGEKDLFLFDRGYPSYDLFNEILIKNGHFCARLTIANWNVAKELVSSGKQEMIASIIPGHGLRKKYKDLNINTEPIKCRFILVELSTGEKEVLITSLLDEEMYPYYIFKELYHLRWAVEESYKKDKLVLQFENFSGYSLIAIQQDFFATILLGNITSILASGLDDRINMVARSRKYKYQLNTTVALSKVKDSIGILFNRSNIYDIINKIINAFLSSILPIRPNRRFFRKQRKTYRDYKGYYKTYMTM